MQIYFNFIKHNQKEHLKALCVRFRIKQAEFPTISALYGTIGKDVADRKGMSFEFTYSYNLKFYLPANEASKPAEG